MQIQNQFAQTPELGQVDLTLSTNTISVLIDETQVGVLIPGQAVKLVDTVDGVPSVIGCDSDTDEVYGFLNYNIKNQTWEKGQAAEISSGGNVIFLKATEAIARGVQVVIDTSEIGGVKNIGDNLGANIVGWSFDKAVSVGEIFRVYLQTPSYNFEASGPVCPSLENITCLAYENAGSGIDWCSAEYPDADPECLTQCGLLADEWYGLNCI